MTVIVKTVILIASSFRAWLGSCIRTLGCVHASAIAHTASGSTGVTPYTLPTMCSQVLVCKLIDMLDPGVPWDLGPEYDEGEQRPLVLRDER
jgi:hypothetical protein